MTDYRVNFKDLKALVGIDDVAYALGYRLDRRAGVGRYIELVLGNGNSKLDTIIISHPNDKAAQTFFRRDGSKGDVITLIRENLRAFAVSGKDEWQQVAQVLAQFARMPEPKFLEDREYVRAAGLQRPFDPDRFEVLPIHLNRIPNLFRQRGVSDCTVQSFAPFICLIRDKHTHFEGYNIGFPYRNGEDDRVRGYEIRGYGSFKSKAAGSDSSSAAWVADFSQGGPSAVRSVFLFESALDAMAFFQLNRTKLKQEVALVSLGGTFADNQIRGVMQRFPNARLFDCFDNDLAGRVYGIRLIALVENIPMKITKMEKGILVEARGKQCLLSTERSIAAQMRAELNIRYKVGQWSPPSAFKDWNDCLLQKPAQALHLLSKEDRTEALYQKRRMGMNLG